MNWSCLVYYHGREWFSIWNICVLIHDAMFLMRILHLTCCIRDFHSVIISANDRAKNSQSHSVLPRFFYRLERFCHTRMIQSSCKGWTSKRQVGVIHFLCLRKMASSFKCYMLTISNACYILLVRNIKVGWWTATSHVKISIFVIRPTCAWSTGCCSDSSHCGHLTCSCLNHVLLLLLLFCDSSDHWSMVVICASSYLIQNNSVTFRPLK